MNKNKKKWLQRLPHILCGIVVVFVLAIFISKAFNFLNGDVLDFTDWVDDPDEIVYENSDYILPLMITEDIQLEDDGELTVLCIGNHPFYNDQSLDTGVCNLVADLTDATVINCGFPNSTISSSLPTFDAQAYAWDAFSFYWVATALCQGNTEIYDELLAAIPDLDPNIVASVERLKAVDMNKVDMLAVMYDGYDYQLARRVNDDENPESITTYLGAFNTAIDLFQETYPHIRIIVMSPTYCFGLGSQGELISSDIQSYANEFLSTYSIKLSEAAYQQSVSFVDNLYGTIHEDIAPEYLSNYLDLNEEGRKLVAQRLADAINKYPTPIVQ